MTALSIVVPLFNEEANVAPLLVELREFLSTFEPNSEIVLVDDGSTDGTAAAAEAAMNGASDVRLIRFGRNAGQTAAFAAGFGAARGELIAAMDGDLQADPRDLATMFAALKSPGVDFVYGRRVRRADGFVKLVSTRVANGVRNFLTGERIADTGCPLKLFRREVVEAIAPYARFSGMHRFFVTLGHLEGFRSAESVVTHRPRVAGKSKYGVMNRVFRALRDCLVVRWMQRRRVSFVAEERAAAGRPA